jgi:hypothetical protein
MTDQTVLLLGTSGAVPCVLNGNFIMALWCLSEDGSGKLNQGEGRVVAACYLIQSDRATDLCKAWRSRLEVAGFTYCHMRAMMMKKPPFENLDAETELYPLLRDLAVIAQKSGGLVIGGPSLRDSVPAAAKSTFNTAPYFLSLEGCFQKALQQAFAADKKPSIAALCAFDAEESCKSLQIFNRLRSRSTFNRDSLSSIMFCNSNDWPLVQITDMAGYCLREIVGPNPRTFIAELYELISPGSYVEYQTLARESK